METNQYLTIHNFATFLLDSLVCNLSGYNFLLLNISQYLVTLLIWPFYFFTCILKYFRKSMIAIVSLKQTRKWKKKTTYDSFSWKSY